MKLREIKLGSRWRARVRGEAVTVRVISLSQTAHGPRIRCYNETSGQELTSPRKFSFLRESVPASGSLLPAPRGLPSIRHACIEVREDERLNKRFFAAYKKTVELYEKIQKTHLQNNPPEEKEGTLVMEGYMLVWSEDESEETLDDAIRRLTGFSLVTWRQRSTKEILPSLTGHSFTFGDWKLMDYTRKASELWKIQL